MRLSGLGPGPSLFIQRQGQNNGQVDELERNQKNEMHPNEDKNDQTTEAASEATQGETSRLKDPMDDPDVRAEVMDLQTIEDKVIAHEQAHMAAGGEFTGGASYGYSMGPDGKRYITSGEVSISVPSTGEPEDLLHAMDRVRAAALAPADPSSQDQSVAARATSRMASLRTEIARQKAAEIYGGGKTKENGGPEKVAEKADPGNPNSDSVGQPEGSRAQSPEERQHLNIVI